MPKFLNIIISFCRGRDFDRKVLEKKVIFQKLECFGEKKSMQDLSENKIILPNHNAIN